MKFSILSDYDYLICSFRINDNHTRFVHAIYFHTIQPLKKKEGLLKRIEIVSNLWKSQFSPLQTREKMSRLLPISLANISKILYSPWKLSYSNNKFECSKRLVISNASKLFGRFQIHVNRVTKICMICKIYDLQLKQSSK